MESLQRLGVQLTGRVPLPAGVTPDNAYYLRTKVERMRHLLTLG
jgi:GTP cyclohydrolase II